MSMLDLWIVLKMLVWLFDFVGWNVIVVVGRWGGYCRFGWLMCDRLKRLWRLSGLGRW